MKNKLTLLLLAILFTAVGQSQAKVFAVRMPAILPTSPMLIKTGIISIPNSQIPSINVPNIIPTIGELPLPIISVPTLPAQTAAFSAPEHTPVASFHAARVHAVAVPLVDADASSSRRSEQRDTVENRLRTRRLVEFVRETLELDDETTLEDLESAFDGRATENVADDNSGTVVLPERELEEELGLR